MNKQETFSEYIINTFDRICDLRPENYQKLRSLMDRIYGDYFDVKAFKEEFGLQEFGFMSIYNFLVNGESIEAIQEFGKRCYLNSLVVNSSNRLLS